MNINKPDFYKLITPEMQKVVDHVREWNEAHPPTADFRQDYIDERAFWNEGGPVPAKVLEETVEGPYGAIPVRLHYPDDKAPKGMTIFLHGGSFYLGNNDTHSRAMRVFMEESDTVVIGVDYRLSPEYRYPSWIMETVAVVDYFRKNAKQYGLDPNDVSFCGDSAGAFLCMAAMLYLRDRDADISFINSMILYYGNFGMFDSMTHRLYGNEIDGMMREYDTELYPTALIEEKDLGSPYYNILYNDLTKNVPPCFICCGTIDPMLDNSRTLYEILHIHGMPCELALYPGVMHAFVHYTSMLADARDAMHRGGEYVRAHKPKA